MRYYPDTTWMKMIQNRIPMKNPPKKYHQSPRDRRILMRKRREMTKRLLNTTTQEKSKINQQKLS